MVCYHGGSTVYENFCCITTAHLYVALSRVIMLSISTYRSRETVSRRTSVSSQSVLDKTCQHLSLVNVSFSAIYISRSDQVMSLGSCSHTHASISEQYNLVVVERVAIRL